jgi:hypothetical protein
VELGLVSYTSGDDKEKEKDGMFLTLATSYPEDMYDIVFFT